MLAARSVYQCLCVPYVLCWRFCCFVCLPGQKLYYNFSTTLQSQITIHWAIHTLFHRWSVHYTLAHSALFRGLKSNERRSSTTKLESKVFEAIEHQPTEPSIQSGITNSKQIKVKLIEFRFKLLFLSPSRTEFYSEFEILLRWWITKSRIWNCETSNSTRMGIYFIGPPWS